MAIYSRHEDASERTNHYLCVNGPVSLIVVQCESVPFKTVSFGVLSLMVVSLTVRISSA